jgi:hypothetical protein
MAYIQLTTPILTIEASQFDSGIAAIQLQQSIADLWWLVVRRLRGTVISGAFYAIFSYV